jgi:hypothetical protein
MTQEHIKKGLKKWVNNHKDCWQTDDFGVAKFWYVSNCLGDLLGNPDWFYEFVKELEENK